MNEQTNTKSTKTETKKHAGRPPTLIFPKRGKFTAKQLAEKFNVTIPAAHSRIKKALNAKSIFPLTKQEKTGKGRKATFYTMEIPGSK